MEKRSLPLNFYCRSARLVLKKAAFARKSNLFADELRHLKKFSSLALSVIPSHHEYQSDQGKKLAQDLEICLDDVRERIEELETNLCSSPECLEENEWKRPSGKRIWERFARKLYEAAAPCFTSKIHPAPHQTNELASPDSFKEKTFRGPHLLSPMLAPNSKESGLKSMALNKNARNCFTDVRDNCYSSERFDSCGVNHTHQRARFGFSEDSPAFGIFEKKLISLETLVFDLRESVEGLKLRVEEEGKRWRGRVDGLERKIRLIKDESQEEFREIKSDMKTNMAEVSDCYSRAEEQSRNLRTEVELMLDSSVGEMEDFKQRHDRFMKETHGSLKHSIEEKVAESSQILKADLKHDVGAVERGLSRNVDSLQKEMASRYESLLIDVEMGQQQINTLVKQKLESLIPQRTEFENASNELQSLKAQLETISGDVKIFSEESFVRMKNHVHDFEKKAMHAKLDGEVLMKDCELQVRQVKANVVNGQMEMKSAISCLHEKLESQNLKLAHLAEKLSTEEIQRKLEIESLRSEGKKSSGNEDIMERVDKFFKLCMSCLDDIKNRVCQLENKVEVVEEEKKHASSEVEIERHIAATTTAAVAVSHKRNENSSNTGSCSSPSFTGSGRIRFAVTQLNRQMKEVFRRLTVISSSKLTCTAAAAASSKKKLEKQEAIKSRNDVVLMEGLMSIENKIKAAAVMMNTMSDRLHKLEKEYKPLEDSIQQVKGGNNSLQKAASYWLPRYECTAKLVMEMETKISNNSTHTNTCISRLCILEDRVENIVSATYTNFRVLDAKVDHMSIGMQSALEIASEAEDKCSALGGELVKIFRLLISSRENPSKQEEEEEEEGKEAKKGDDTNLVIKRINLKFGGSGIISNSKVQRN